MKLGKLEILCECAAPRRAEKRAACAPGLGSFRVLVGLCLTIVTHAPIAQTILTGGDTEQEVIAVEQELWADFQAGDIKKITELMDHDFTGFSSSLPSRMESKDAELSHYRLFHDDLQGKFLGHRIERPRVQVFGRVAILTYNFVVEVSMQNQKLVQTGKQTSVWVHRDEGWRQVHYHYTYDKVEPK